MTSVDDATRLVTLLPALPTCFQEKICENAVFGLEKKSHILQRQTTQTNHFFAFVVSKASAKFSQAFKALF